MYILAKYPRLYKTVNPKNKLIGLLEKNKESIGFTSMLHDNKYIFVVVIQCHCKKHESKTNIIITTTKFCSKVCHERIPLLHLVVMN